ncbi:MAG: cell wall hydrolase [Alphaproteobacteria bacterium]|nr:cell wall hydrolase [Alphaproteobacteria bacterium]
MQLTLIKNSNNTQSVLYKLARVIYAETSASSLQLVEAMASMVYNIYIKYNISFDDIADNEKIFSVLNSKSDRHENLTVIPTDKKFQMCLRVVQKMLNGNLRDNVFGATKFHHIDVMPDWARARGYIAEVDDVLFYL